MGLLSSAARTALATREVRAHWLVTIAYPGGTKRYAHAGVPSASLGQYEGKLLSIGQVGRSSMDRGFSLEPVEVVIQVDDTDRHFGDLVAGANADSIEGSAVTLQLAIAGVAAGDWPTEFTGVVDQYEFSAATAYSLRCRVDDRVLRRVFPRDVITQALWPNADPSVRGQIPPRLYGKWDSGGNGGALPTLHVDITGIRFMVCAGRAKAIDRVYVAGAQVTSGFTASYPLVGGRMYTLLTFTAAPDGDVTVDAQGYETVGDGSGTLITNPADQLKHALVNWVYGDYRTGAWLADATAPVNTSWFSTAATFLSDRGHQGAKYIAGEQLEGGELFNEWCASLQCRPFWTALGKLAIRFEDHGTMDVYPTDGYLRWDRDLAGPFKLKHDSQQRIDRVHGRYLRDEVGGDYTQALEVRDPTIAREAADSIELPWAHGAVV